MMSKSPVKSKINIAAFLTIAVGVLALWDIIPSEIEVNLLKTIVLIQPIAIYILRTYFTDTQLSWEAEPMPTSPKKQRKSKNKPKIKK